MRVWRASKYVKGLVGGQIIFLYPVVLLQIFHSHADHCTSVLTISFLDIACLKMPQAYR